MEVSDKKFVNFSNDTFCLKKEKKNGLQVWIRMNEFVRTTRTVATKKWLERRSFNIFTRKFEIEHRITVVRKKEKKKKMVWIVYCIVMITSSSSMYDLTIYVQLYYFSLKRVHFFFLSPRSHFLTLFSILLFSLRYILFCY